MHLKYWLIAICSIVTISCSRSKTTSSEIEDTSSSGLVAGSVGSAAAQSDSNGNFALLNREKPFEISDWVIPYAYAANTCPRITTAAGSGCTNGTSNAYVLLNLSNCSFGSSAATWSGTLEVSLANSSAVICGTFPTVTSTSLQRQYVSSASVPSTATRTSARGTAVTIDHASSNLANFDNQTITPIIGSGYGTQVTFNGSGRRTGVKVQQRVYMTNGFDHSVDGTLTLSEAGSGANITRTASGTVKVYHNKLKVVGTSTFSNVTYDNTSCFPTGGSVTTSFAQGANVQPTTLGSKYVGKSETLTFAGSGSATLTDYSGATSKVQMSHCL